MIITKIYIMNKDEIESAKVDAERTPRETLSGLVGEYNRQKMSAERALTTITELHNIYKKELEKKIAWECSTSS